MPKKEKEKGLSHIAIHIIYVEDIHHRGALMVKAIFKFTISFQASSSNQCLPLDWAYRSIDKADLEAPKRGGGNWVKYQDVMQASHPQVNFKLFWFSLTSCNFIFAWLTKIATASLLIVIFQMVEDKTLIKLIIEANWPNTSYFSIQNNFSFWYPSCCIITCWCEKWELPSNITRMDVCNCRYVPDSQPICHYLMIADMNRPVHPFTLKLKT